MLTHKGLLFLERDFSSKQFLPAINVPIGTMHEWSKRGFVALPAPGRGKTLFVPGETVLLLYVLTQLSRGGRAPKLLHRGLRDCVSSFREAYVCGWVAGEHDVADAFAVYRFREGVDQTSSPDAEWELRFGSDFINDGMHICMACGGMPSPAVTYVNLTQCLDILVGRLVHLL